jgi:hypothetical protein
MLGWGHALNAAEHKQKDNQEAHKPSPQIIRTQRPFTRLIEKKQGQR